VPRAYLRYEILQSGVASSACARVIPANDEDDPHVSAVRRVRQQKKFFFEKKNQKTFANYARRFDQAGSLISKSFLLLFFKKEGLTSQGRQAARQSCLAAGLYQ
jgi:hypothetical protein